MDEADQSFIDHSIKFERVNIRAWLSHYSKCECIALSSVNQFETLGCEQENWNSKENFFISWK